LPELNPNQKTAVQYINGPLLILAGAGSGKTSLLIHKIAWLIKEYDVEPRQIFALTYTNKAAREMKTRVADLLNGRDIQGLTICTYYALGLSILREHLPDLGYSSGFSIYNSEGSRALVRKLLHAEYPEQISLATPIQRRISRWKKALVTPEPGSTPTDSVDELAARLYDKYEQRLLAFNAMDLDDLILKPVKFFQQHPQVLTEWHKRIQHLLVDEFQDSTGSQYEMVRQLASKHSVLTVVGDDDQSIHAVDGAEPLNLQSLQREIPTLKIIRLEKNYRSTGRILKAANALIANNQHIFEKALWGERAYGEPIQILKARSEEHEAERVVSTMINHKFKHGSDFRDYAILFRRPRQAHLLQRVLRERRIPYFLSGATSLFDKTEVKDIMAYLRLLCNPVDDCAFLRVLNTPRREIGAGTLEQLLKFSAENGIGLLQASLDTRLDKRVSSRQLMGLRTFTNWLMAVVERAQGDDPIKIICDLLADLRYEDWLRDTCNDQKIAERKMENILELISWMQRLSNQHGGKKTLNELVACLSLIGLLDKNGEDNPGDYVSLMTLHAAKGHEFTHVFIVGMEEGLLPHDPKLGTTGQSLEAAKIIGETEINLEEERRLAYVGITRARQTLTFSLAERRKLHGEIIDCQPSRFLSELPQTDLEWVDQESEQDIHNILGRGGIHMTNLRTWSSRNP
jgi:ATP-dependent DNA helicase Rep